MGWTRPELVAAWRAADQAGYAVISCFDHLTASPAAVCSWDAVSLLTAMSAETNSARLAVDVLNVGIRDPFLTASQLAVAQASSGGRIEVGLGAGSYHLARFDHRALGIPFLPYAQRLARLEAFCQVLPKLWVGQTVTEPALNLSEASLGPIGIKPPEIVVGGASDGLLRIAARHADAWNCSLRGRLDFADANRRLDATCRSVGRQQPIGRRAQVFVRDVQEGGFKEVVRQYEQAGTDTLIFVLVDERHPDRISQLADEVLR